MRTTRPRPGARRQVPWGAIFSRYTHNWKLAHRSVAIVGFLIAGAFLLPATLATSPAACVAYTCLVLFGLELTVGVSWPCRSTLEAGVSEGLQDHLGHHNIQNTLIYAKFTDARRQQRDKRLRDW
jgi:hypothetical protein